ncbi:MAG: carbohydrate kinase family protein [bacterium]
MQKVLVTGSVAYDYIMNFPGGFQDHILPDKLHILNVSFVVETHKKEFGGTAGNIAYNLSLLKEDPLIATAVGKDFAEYKKHLEKNGANLKYIKEISSDDTATAKIITDQKDNQITAFYVGAIKDDNFPVKEILETEKPELAILAPTNKEGMLIRAQELKEAGIPYIFDPGQMTPQFSGEEFEEIIAGSHVTIGNDYEIELIMRATEKTVKELADLTEILVTTLGEEGSRIYNKGEVIDVGAAKPKNTSDPTGAGDAFRAGFIKGLLHKQPLYICGQLGAVTSVYTVEMYGTQTHKFSSEEFCQRYQENFGEDISKLFS